MASGWVTLGDIQARSSRVRSNMPEETGRVSLITKGTACQVRECSTWGSWRNTRPAETECGIVRPQSSFQAGSGFLTHCRFPENICCPNEVGRGQGGSCLEMLPALLGGPGASSLGWQPGGGRWMSWKIETRAQSEGGMEGSRGCSNRIAGTSLLAPRRRLQLEAGCHPVGFPASLSEVKERGTGLLGFKFKKGMDSSRKGRISKCAQGGVKAQGVPDAG